jgi:hypothetical protein
VRLGAHATPRFHLLIGGGGGRRLLWLRRSSPPPRLCRHRSGNGAIPGGKYAPQPYLFDHSCLGNLSLRKARSIASVVIRSSFASLIGAKTGEFGASEVSSSLSVGSLRFDRLRIAIGLE